MSVLVVFLKFLICIHLFVDASFQSLLVALLFPSQMHIFCKVYLSMVSIVFCCLFKWSHVQSLFMLFMFFFFGFLTGHS